MSGCVAAVPLLLGLRWTLTTSTKAMRRLVALVVEQLGPLSPGALSSSWSLLAALAGISRGDALPRRGAGRARSAAAGVEWRWWLRALRSDWLTSSHRRMRFWPVWRACISAALFLLQGNLIAPIVAHAVYDFVALNYVARLYRESLQVTRTQLSG